MTIAVIMEKTIHQGRNVKRFREMLGIQQEALADSLGEDWTQKQVSLLEAKEVIDGETLEEVARVLKVSAEAIKSFDEEKAVSIISNTFNDHAILNGVNYHPTFNPIDKWADAVEEIKRLYEALLKEKDEKIGLLERIINGK